MNAAAFSAIEKIDVVNYVGPIDPPVVSWQKALFKMGQVAGRKGDFYFFSQRRLQKIADEVRARCANEAELEFFHGFTPWILVRPERPYLAWSDCTFSQYIEIFHRRSRFRRADIERIENAEADWLNGARKVLFTSRWAADHAIARYRLKADRVDSVGIFGEVDELTQDAYTGSKEFVFISTNFEAKGGRIVLAAFHELQSRHPDATLTIVGDCPIDFGSTGGVRAVGFLRKEVPDERRRFQDILGTARAVVSATKSDISPVLYVEAGYLGCPVISSRRFAIPEIVEDGVTGLLLDNPEHISSVTAAMDWMLEHDGDYQAMRRAARARAKDVLSRRKFEERLCTSVLAASSRQPCQA